MPNQLAKFALMDNMFDGNLLTLSDEFFFLLPVISPPSSLKPVLALRPTDIKEVQLSLLLNCARPSSMLKFEVKNTFHCRSFSYTDPLKKTIHDEHPNWSHLIRHSCW